MDASINIKDEQGRSVLVQRYLRSLYRCLVQITSPILAMSRFQKLCYVLKRSKQEHLRQWILAASNQASGRESAYTVSVVEGREQDTLEGSDLDRQHELLFIELV